MAANLKCILLYRVPSTVTLHPSLWITVFCLFIAIILQNRSFIIGYTVAVIFIIVTQLNTGRRRIITLIITAIILAVATAIVFKSDSTLGRVLIYKISFNILYDHFPRGIGWSQFGVRYGEYQIEYFKSGLNSGKELLLADNTTSAFNDYLQFVIELGILGLLILYGGFWIVINSISTAIKRNSRIPHVLSVAIAQLIAISTAAFFTHIFEHSVYLLPFIISLTIIFKYAYFKKVGYFMWIIFFLLTCCVMFVKNLNYVSNFKSYDRLEEARESLKAGYLKEAVTIYKELYTNLKFDVEYLNEYAGLLAALDSNTHAEIVAERLVSINNSNIFYQSLGDIYFKNGKMEKANNAYLNGVYRVPNRFGTRYSLFKFYLKIKKINEAIVVGHQILQLPVKVPSDTVDRIILQTRETLRFLDKSDES